MQVQVLGLEQDELPDDLEAQKSKEAEDVWMQEVSLKRENGTCVSHCRGRITVPSTVAVCLEVRFS